MLPFKRPGQYIRTPEIRAKQSLAMVGKHNSPATQFKKGHRDSAQTRLRKSLSHQADRHWNWKGGVHKKERWNPQYKAWRSAVMYRDNYICQVCLQQSKYLHVDHIEPWSKNTTLRFSVNNGRTLCRACHYYVTYRRKMPEGSKWGLQYGTSL